MESTIRNLSTYHQTKLNQFMLTFNWQCGSPGKSVTSQVPGEHPILPSSAEYTQGTQQRVDTGRQRGEVRRNLNHEKDDDTKLCHLFAVAVITQITTTLPDMKCIFLLISCINIFSSLSLSASWQVGHNLKNPFSGSSGKSVIFRCYWEHPNHILYCSQGSQESK